MEQEPEKPTWKSPMERCGKEVWYDPLAQILLFEKWQFAPETIIYNVSPKLPTSSHGFKLPGICNVYYLSGYAVEVIHMAYFQSM